MAAPAYGGLETHSPSRLFHFRDFSANIDTNITSYKSRGSSIRQVHTADAGAIWAKYAESDQRCLRVARPFSFGFIFPSNVNTARYFHF